jgi:hypothetical protein
MPTLDKSSHINVDGQIRPLAPGESPAREAGPAGDMAEVPQGGVYFALIFLTT